MTPNLSLVTSVRLQQLLRTDLLQQLTAIFPTELVSSFESKQPSAKRDRVFTPENTVLTMLATAMQDDKSLQNSVNIFSTVFEKRAAQMKLQEADLLLEQQQQADQQLRKRGRPKLFHSKLPKSKTTQVSTNTAAYTKARQRLDYDLVKEVFKHSTDFTSFPTPLWYGRQCFNTDGTYLQMQDSPDLQKKYYVNKKDGAYPQALLQAIVCQGTGQVTDFLVGTRHQSELELVSPLIDGLPKGSLLLGDDLYNCYAIFALVINTGCDLIVPGKRIRNYTVVKQIAPGDEIVELTKTQTPKWWAKEWSVPPTLTVRRLSYLSPVDNTTEWVIYTTLLDEKIPKTDIIMKYATRWDIETTIREMKTLMDINIVRSKSEDMVLKEITVAITAYNMLRKIITQSVQKTDFPPKEDIFQELLALNKDIFVDKKGRVYRAWSPGRYGKVAETD